MFDLDYGLIINRGGQCWLFLGSSDCGAINRNCHNVSQVSIREERGAAKAKHAKHGRASRSRLDQRWVEGFELVKENVRFWSGFWRWEIDGLHGNKKRSLEV
jgi:hypothetical protein